MSIGLSFPPEDFSEGSRNLSSPDVAVGNPATWWDWLSACAFTGAMVNCWHDLAISCIYFPSVYEGNPGK